MKDDTKLIDAVGNITVGQVHDTVKAFNDAAPILIILIIVGLLAFAALSFALQWGLTWILERHEKRGRRR